MQLSFRIGRSDDPTVVHRALNRAVRAEIDLVLQTIDDVVNLED